MSRLIRPTRKIGGPPAGPPVTILIQGLDNIDSNSGSDVSQWNSNPCGSGAGRLAVVFGAARKAGSTNGILTQIVFDGTSMPLYGLIDAGSNNENITSAVGVLELTDETGNVAIRLHSQASEGSWSMSYFILEDWESATPLDSEAKGVTSGNSVTMDNALIGDPGGFVAALSVHGDRTSVATWGNLLTSASAGVSTGNNTTKDHKHHMAYDILAGARNAVETITYNKTNRLCVSMISIR